jgi:cytochrome c oxidase assembly protein subunit 15
MTGSGMGCPDWPKCFGLLIPPTAEDQIIWSADSEYEEGQMVIESNTLWQAQTDHISSGRSFSPKDLWVPYTKHDYAKFNAFHTWVEYINRLLGALSGIPILLLFSLALTSRKVVPIMLASGTLMSVLFVSWLGKLVVDGNLIPFSVTIHAVSALTILAFLVGMMQYLNGERQVVSKSVRILIIASLVIAFLQLVLGTQVREQVDILLKDEVSRPKILDSLPAWWKIHRTAIWPLLILHLAWAVQIIKIDRIKSFAWILFSNLGMPALVQPAHILLGFGLILVDLRVLLASKV